MDLISLFELPTVLWQTIYRDYLSIEDVLTLDGAVCQREMRTNYLLAMNHYRIEIPVYTVYEDIFLRWLLSRGVDYDSPYVVLTSENLILAGRQFFVHHGQQIRKLLIGQHKVAFCGLLSQLCGAVNCLVFTGLLDINPAIPLLGVNILALGVNDSHIGDNTVVVITTHCPNLRYLDLMNCDVLSSNAGVLAAESLQHMHTLSLCYTRTDNITIESIADHCGNRLVSLFVMECPDITAESIAHMLPLCPHLLTLSYGAEDTDKRQVNPALMSQLSTLIIYGLEDDEIEYLQDIPNHVRQVIRMEIDFNVLNEAVVNFSSFSVENMPNLRYITCVGLDSTDALVELAQLRPDLKVDWTAEAVSQLELLSITYE